MSGAPDLTPASAAPSATKKRAVKSYWQSVYLGSDNAKRAVASWFSPLSEGMTPYKAEILCDIETDAEKKIRAFMSNKDGKKYRFVRTTGRKFSVSMQPWPTDGATSNPERSGT